ncbi:phage portal protein [Priestia filamentosa]|uniref:phage portal protein n=1 Tax=Priestia filamentosa TaxID=1402861 RepID=UPI000A08DEF1|nr:phage portal protein [Priestia filamentosa]OXS67242.1 phage portal protein [Priestia filamentosa]SMF53586.1 phage portal protein, SPP1 family [Priestia filamentosa]
MGIDEYVQFKHNSNSKWFIEEVSSVKNQARVQRVLELKEYLDGEHDILYSPSYEYNGKTFEPRKIVLQYAKTILNFQTSFLMGNPITLTGKENVQKEYQKVYKRGNFHTVNRKITDKLNKYGSCAEYVYLDSDKKIKSKVIDPSELYPVYDHENMLVAVIQANMVDNIQYYTVFKHDTVERYGMKGDKLQLISVNPSLTGLPIIYHTNDNEQNEKEGRSSLEDYKRILDTLEQLISKFVDSFYKTHSPVLVTVGQGIAKDSNIPSNIAGVGLRLDDAGDAKFLVPTLDSKSFRESYDTLLQSLLDVSQTPAVSMNKTDISNLSETSIKMLFQLAIIRAGIYEDILREGIEQRHEKIKVLLALNGVKVNEDDYDTLDMVFNLAMPSNDQETIEKLSKQFNDGALSVESYLEQSPFVNNPKLEMKRLGEEKDKVVQKVEDNKDKDIDNDKVKEEL